MALGLGWNFMFTGATLLLTSTYTVGEKAHAQGANDLAVFVPMITSSAASGALSSASGWIELNRYAAPFVALAAAAIVWLWVRRSHGVQQASLARAAHAVKQPALRGRAWRRS